MLLPFYLHSFISVNFLLKVKDIFLTKKKVFIEEKKAFEVYNSSRRVEPNELNRVVREL